MKQYIRLYLDPTIGAQIGMQAANNAIGAGMGLLLQKHNDKRQLKQQSKLLEQQYGIDNRMAEANYARQMRLFQDTGYEAQMKQLKEAGLNPALMYKSGGPGGTTAAATGAVHGANAPAGGMEIMNMMMNKAQMELIKAQTNKTNAEAGAIPTTIKKTEAEIQSITQGIENQKVQAELIEAQRYATNIMSDINARSSNSQVASAAKRVERETQEIQALMRENNINEQTIQDKINLIRAEALGQAIQNTLGEQKTEESKATIKKMAADIIQRSIQLDQEQQKIEIQKWVETVKANFPSIGNVLGRGLNDLIEGIIGASKGGSRTTYYEPPKHNK